MVPPALATRATWGDSRAQARSAEHGGRSDDIGNTDPPPPPVSRAEQESKWTELMKHMAWRAAKRLFQMAPPVAMARQMDRHFQIAEMAVKQAAIGDWDLAGNTILEIPQDAAESAARILVSPIYAVMAVPAAVRTVMDPQADPEKRGEAAVEALEGIAVAVTAVVGGAKALKGSIGDLRAAGQKDAHHVIQDAAVRDLPGYDTNAAPGVQLPGPSNQVGTPHYRATQVQRQSGGGTYGAERRIGYKSLRKAGFSAEAARQEIQRADANFESIGVSGQTATRIPGNR